MSLRPKGRRKRGGKDVLGVALLAVTGSLLVAGLVLGYAVRPPPLDPQSLCRLDQPPPAVTLVLVESSDALEARHKRRLKAAIAEEAQRLPRYGRLILLGLRPDTPREPKALFSLCNPGDGRLANPLFANPQRIQVRWQTQFLEPLQAAANRAAAGRKGARASPLIEAISAAALEPDFASPEAQRRFVLVSDLLEHDPETGFSTYSESPSLGRYTQLSPGFHAPDLSGVAVRVVALDREGLAARQVAARDALWTPLFEAAQAESVNIEGL